MNRGKGMKASFVFSRLLDFIMWINFAICLIVTPFTLFFNSGVNIKRPSQGPSLQTAYFRFGLVLTD